MAGPLFFDRVEETTTTTGTGTYTLGGAIGGHQSFAAVGDGNTCNYCATDGTSWEVGLGTYAAAGTTLARTTILASSNSGLAVSWGAGSKTIWLDLPAAQVVPASSFSAYMLGLLSSASAIALNDAIDVQGANIASAATVNLTTATGPHVDITGTTTITAVTLAQGAVRLVRAAGIFQITPSSTLVVNGATAANQQYITAVGDLLLFEGFAAGVVRCSVIGSGAGAPPGMTLLTTVALTSGTTVDVIGLPRGNYKGFFVEVINTTPTGASPITLQVALSTNLGVNWGSTVGISPATNTSSTGCAGCFFIWNISAFGQLGKFLQPFMGVQGGAGGNFTTVQNPIPNNAQAIDSIRFQWDGVQTFTAGSANIYGVH